MNTFKLKYIASITMAGLFMLTSLTSHAALSLSDINDNVTAVRKNAVEAKNTLSNKVVPTLNGLDDKVASVTAKVNTQIDKVTDISEVLETLKFMKEKFYGTGFDPAQLLDMIDVEEVKAKVEELKQQHADIKASLNDPNLETFRAELLTMLKDMNELVSEETGVSSVTPFQTLVEVAPPPVLAILKSAFEPLFAPLKAQLATVFASKRELEEIGVWQIISRADPSPAELCEIARTKSLDLIWVRLWKHEGRLASLKNIWDKIEEHAQDLQTKINSLNLTIGIHGYALFKLPQISVVEKISSLVGTFEYRKDRVEHYRTYVEWIAEKPSRCDAL